MYELDEYLGRCCGNFCLLGTSVLNLIWCPQLYSLVDLNNKKIALLGDGPGNPSLDECAQMYSSDVRSRFDGILLCSYFIGKIWI